MDLDFPALFDEHYDAIAGYLVRRLVDRSMAEDLAQLTFLEAFDRRATFDPSRGAPRGWLFGIATHLLSRHFRAQRRQLRAYGRAASREPVARDDSDEICDRVDAVVSTRAIAEALAALSEGDLAVLTLHAWAELPHDEIATALGIPLGTVKSRLSRARRLVRGHLATEPGSVDSHG
jgi:RNA polymerase sigma factor (sigma-70 family)